MEHYRSTLAVTALAVSGLIAAAHMLHPGNFETQPRGGRVVAVSAEAAPGPTIWSDPPVRLRGAEPARLMADSASVLAPRLTVVLPANAMTVQPLPSALVAPPVIERKAKADPLGDLIRGLDSEREG